MERSISPWILAFSAAFAVAAATGAAAGDVGSPSSDDEETRAAVAEVLKAGRHPWLAPASLRDVAGVLRALYPDGAEVPIWFDGGRPSPALDSTASALGDAAALGLDPARYGAPRLQEEALRARSGMPARDRALLDVAVSAALARELADAHRGRLPPANAERAGLPRRALDLPALVREARRTGSAPEVIASVEPRYPGYARLKRALAIERSRPEPPALPPLPARGKVEPGDAWAGVPALRALLASLGDLPASAATEGPAGPEILDVPLAEAVKRFQERHGLAVDGVVGKGTVAALDVPPSRRVRQIELALERWRWLPDPDRRVVIVELPQAELRALDVASPEGDLHMKVVIGETGRHATPMLSAKITAVVFRPYWIPPPNILKEEILPRVRATPGWLSRRDMEIVATPEEYAPPLEPTPEVLARVARGQLILRQRPGPRNDLGDVKFVVSGGQCIELHGTPHGRLFDLPRRDRSHGCIRLERPDDFAAWMLSGEPAWTPARMEEAKAQDHPTWVQLREPVPVVSLYATASVDPDGTEHFLADIYGDDAELERALATGAR